MKRILIISGIASFVFLLLLTVIIIIWATVTHFPSCAPLPHILDWLFLIPFLILVFTGIIIFIAKDNL